MTDEQVGSSQPTYEVANFDELIQPTVGDEVYFGNLSMPDWNDVHKLDLSILFTKPASRIISLL